MIFTDRTIIVQKGISSINDTIILYRGDKGVEIRFTLNEGSPFRFGSGASPNIIEKTEAAYGQLVIKTPNDLPSIFSEIAPTNEGKIVFTITAEMIDEITEVGNYTFQIRLFDESMNSRATLPEVVNGIEIREPIAAEDTNEVGIATVGYALTTAAANEDAFDLDGNYNKTTWKTKDRITAAKLNKMEVGIDGVNQKVTSGRTASNITIADTGNYFTSTNVEGALQEVGSQIKDIANYSLAKGTDGLLYIKKQDGTLIGTGVEVGSGSGSADLSTLSISIDGQTLKLLDGTTVLSTVEIPTAVVTDEQLTAIIQSKIDDGTLGALTIKDGSIGNIKLSAIGQQRINLLNVDASTSGKKINQFNYAGDDASYDLSDYIEIELNTLYYLLGADTAKVSCCLYDSSKNFLSGELFTTVKYDDNGNRVLNLTITAENAKYIRFSYLAANKNIVMFCRDKIRDYVPYNTMDSYLTGEGEQLRDILNENYKITEKNINPNTITPDMTNFCFSDDLNLVDCDNYMEYENSQMKLRYSNYFKVNNKETLYTKVAFYVIYYYDENKNLLSSVQGTRSSTGSPNQTEITINQENVYYARIVYGESNYIDKNIMVTRYKGEQDNYKEFTTKWFELKDSYKEYFIKNVLSASYFTDVIKDVLLPSISPTAGKTLVAFGDSLMQYAGGDGSTGYGFFTQANKYLNMNMNNMGYAGSNWTGAGAGDCKARINQLVTDGIAYDVILLGWGTNQDENLGTIEDAPSDSGSMCAVMKWAVQQIRTNFPHSGLGIILPPPGISGGSEEKVNLIKSCCEHSSMHVPYLDLFHSANIATKPIGTGGLGDDQVHLGEHGRNRYASALKPFIEKLVPYINNYSFTYNLTNVTSNKTYKRLSEGTAITITLTADSGYTLDNSSVIVTMGGINVTNDVYSNGQITITMSGDVVITANAISNS